MFNIRASATNLTKEIHKNKPKVNCIVTDFAKPMAFAI